MRRLQAERGLVFIHPFDDPLVIAGQGTIALEMLEAVPALDTLVVPIGGGGLISGMAIAAKAIKPFDPRHRRAGRALSLDVQPHQGTPICRCAATRWPRASLCWATGRSHVQAGRRKYVDDIVLVSEPELERAVSLLISIEKTVAEGAGAAGLAALLAGAGPVQGRNRRLGTMRRQHRYTAAGERTDSRTGARGPPLRG